MEASWSSRSHNSESLGLIPFEMTRTGDDEALVMRGIEAVQRNTMPFLVTLMVRTLRLLLMRSDATDAKAYVRSAVADLLADKLVRWP